MARTNEAAASSQSASSSYAKVYGGAFVPANLGNSIAVYPAAVYDDNQASSGSVKGKGPGKPSSSNAKSRAEHDTAIRFVEYDSLPRSRRELITESYTVFANLQTIANRHAGDDEDGDDAEHMDHQHQALRREGIPSTSQIAYYSRFTQLYRDCVTRYIIQLSSQDEIDTEELSLARVLRDTLHLAHVVYVPRDGRGDGIVSEEVVDWINTTSPWPSAERRDLLTSMSAPYENGDFWGFIYSCILRGHFHLATSILKSLLSHPSTVLVRLTQSCLDLLAGVPRSNSPAFHYESAFTNALRAWRTKLTGLVARLDIEMDEFQEEIQSLEDDADADACQDERYDWQAGFKCMLMLLAGDVSTVLDASEEGWRSALCAWCLLVRPSLRRDDLPETIQSITAKLPADSTLPKENLAIAILSGDVPRVLRLSAETDTWLVAHLGDIFAKLGLLLDSTPIEDISLRDWFILSYTDVLTSDPGLWRCTIDYLASLENSALGQGRMRELLLSIGEGASTSSALLTNDSDDAAKTKGDGTEAGADGMVDDIEEAAKSQERSTTVEDVISACVTYGMEDVARSICLSTSEALLRNKKYGQAVAFAVRGNDARRINRIADMILEEYIQQGAQALTLIDDIPTSLLRPKSNARTNPFRQQGDHDVFVDDDDADDVHYAQESIAVQLASTTRLAFLARYRDLHALYASGERRAAAELLVLLLSSNAAPKTFWAVMLLDAVTLLNDPGSGVGDDGSVVVVSEANTFELMRCLDELVIPVQRAGRDVFGYFDCLVRMQGQGQGGDNNKKAAVSLEGILGQLDVVRYALVQNLARCFAQQQQV